MEKKMRFEKTWRITDQNRTEEGRLVLETASSQPGANSDGKFWVVIARLIDRFLVWRGEP